MLAVFVFVVFSSAIERVSAQEFEVSRTSFTCQGRVPGYYADIETGCRTYHVCDGFSQFSYVCPPRTLFQPSARICDHWYLVQCVQEKEEEKAEKTEGKTESTGHGGDEDHALNSLDPSSGSLDAFDGFNGYNQETDNSEEVTIVNVREQPTTFIYPYKAAEYNRTESATTVTSTALVPEPTTGNFPTENGNVSSVESPPSRKVYRFQLKDFRYLFYIPQAGDQYPPTKGSTDLILVPHKGTLLKFRSTKHLKNAEFPCPAYCNPSFLVSGTCHPCIVIK